MKIRGGFVTNSSSSSFIIVSVGDKIIHSDGSADPDYVESELTSMDIDELIQKLQEAKESGIATVDFEFGGGYDG